MLTFCGEDQVLESLNLGNVIFDVMFRDIIFSIEKTLKEKQEYTNKNLVTSRSRSIKK